MLKNAYGNITNAELDKLVIDGNYKYLTLSPTIYFEFTDIEKSDRNIIQKLSVNKQGEVLGYFSAGINQAHRRIDEMCFIKFRYCYDYVNEKIANDDMVQFMEQIMNHPLYNRVKFQAIAENPANKTYDKWLRQYNGQRFLFTNEVMLPDGNLDDTYVYYFDRTDVT